MIKTGKNKKGYTLLELMLYMTMAVMIIGFSMNMIGITQKQYGHQRSMTRLQGEGRNAIYIIAADLQNTGLKYFLDEVSTDVFELKKIDGVITHKDSSVAEGSRDPSPGTGDASLYIGNQEAEGDFDSIEVFKGILDEDGDFERVLRVKYAVRGSTLMRYEMQAPGTNYEVTSWNPLPKADSTIIAENVEALQFEYSENKIDFNDAPTDKQNIKAIKITLLIRTKRTVSQKAAESSYQITTGGNTVDVTGNFLRRLYTETVEVANNGI